VNANASKIILLFVVVAGLVVAVMIGQWAAAEQLTWPLLIIGGLLGGMFMLALGKNYWYLIPFSVLSNLPAIPLGGRSLTLPEIFITGCFIMFLGRVALKKDRLVLFRLTQVPFLFAFAWILLCWALNPTGFILFGSDTMGARYYLQILLGFASFIVMAAREPTEKDLKWIFGLVAGGLSLSVSYGILTYVFGDFLGARGGAMRSEARSLFEEGYSWQQILSIPAFIGGFVLFGRYKLSEMATMKRAWTVLLYMLMIYVVIYSGKRSATLIVFLMPFMCAFLYKQYRFGVLAIVLGIPAIAMLSMVHDTGIVRFPSRFVRALSWMPYTSFEDKSGNFGKDDYFRKHLHELAIEEIRRNPIIGTGYAMDPQAMARNVKNRGASGTDFVYIYSLTKAWHSTILGYPATFGIPMGAAWMIHLVMVWFLALRLTRRLPHPSMLQMFSAYVFYLSSYFLININNGGHVGDDFLANSWMYGLFFAIYAQTQKEHTVNRLPPTEERTRSVSEAADSKAPYAST